MPAPCYSGPNPIGKMSEAAHRGMWKWIKENAIDKGMSFDEVREEFNNHYFGGSLKPEWVNEFLAARKTPFKRLSDAAWAAQANRKAIQSQAKHLVEGQNRSNLEKRARMILGAPRYATLGGTFHTVVFPFSHAGANLLNPARWLAFARLLRNTYRVADPFGGPVARANYERMMSALQDSKHYDLLRRNGLDFSVHGGESPGGSGASRGFGALVEARFRMAEAALNKHIKPGMSVEDIDSLAREFATWANHATGSGKGLLTGSMPIGKGKSVSLAPLQFGPKLYQSYWNRLLGDPTQTVKTYGQWGLSHLGFAEEPTAGEKAVAMRRLQGATTAAITYSTMLAANQAFLQASGQKDKINWGDPTQSDWLGFKWGGMTWSLPGAAHSEIKLIGQILSLPWQTQADLAKQGMKGAYGNRQLSPRELGDLKRDYVARQLLEYATGKANPLIKLEEEFRTGYGFGGRPLPWSSDKGDLKHPKYSWGEYAWSHAPIPLSGAAKYVYEELRKSGASVTDASMWMRAVMVSAASAFAGTELKPVKEQGPHRTRYGQAQVGR